MSQIEIRKVELFNDHFSKQSLRITFLYSGKNQTIKIECWDLLFGTVKTMAPNMDVMNNMVYWFEIYSDKGLDTNKNLQVTSKFNEGVKLNFLDSHDQVISTKDVPLNNYDLTYRNQDGLYSKPRVWVIGDSHVGEGFKDQTIHSICDDRFCFTPVSLPALTLHRFTTRNFLRYLSTLPILENDSIVISIGEIDIRKNIIKNSKEKRVGKSYFTFSLFQNFLKMIDVLNQQYPNNKIYYEIPHVPFKDEWIKQDKREHFLAFSNETDRMKVWKLFTQLIVDESYRNKKYQIINFNESFTRTDGFFDHNFLRSSDPHLSDGKLYFNLLKNFFQNENI